MHEHSDRSGWQRSTPDVAFAFGHDPGAPRAARLAIGSLLPENSRFADDVNLVASELVSNVVVHTRDGGLLSVWNANPLRLEVRDHDPVLPARREDSDDPGGRGLAIVSTVADRWGSRIDTTGKTLWAEFHRPAN